MITLTREEAMDLLDVLEYPGPSWTEGRMKVAEILRTKFNEYPKNKVHPHEFLKAVEGKENFAGIPVLWAEWPTPEPTIDGWPLYSGLPQPEPEPVAWWHDRGDVVDLNVSGHGTPLYFEPPKKEWVGLTDLEISKIYDDCDEWEHYEYERAIEAKLKEKNGG